MIMQTVMLRCARFLGVRALLPTLGVSLAVASFAQPVLASEIEHLGKPTSPIASMVYVPAGSDILYISGMLASPAKPDAVKGTPEYYGDTETQMNSILTKMKAALEDRGMSLGDIAMMRVYFSGDPAMENKADVKGMMASFTKFFGTPEQPNKPARSIFQTFDLAHQPGQLLEVDAEAVRKAK